MLGGDLLAPLDSVAAVAPYVIGTTRGWYVRFRPVHRFHDLRTPRRFRVEAADVVDGGKVSTGRLMAGGGYYVHRVFVPHGPTEGDSGAAIAAAEEIRYRVEGRVL